LKHAVAAVIVNPKDVKNWLYVIAI